MSDNSDRPPYSRRAAQHSGSKTGSAFAALFRNVLRGTFPQDSNYSNNNSSNSSSSNISTSKGLAKPEQFPSIDIAATGPATDPVTQSAAAEYPRDNSANEIGGIDIGQTSLATAELQTAAEGPHSMELAEGFTGGDSLQSADSQARLSPFDADLLVLECAGLADQDAPMDHRLSALQRLVFDIKGKQLVNVNAMWHAIGDIVRLVFRNYGDNDDGAFQLDSDLRSTARMLILSIIVELAESKLQDSSFGFNAFGTRNEMLDIVSQADGWAEIMLAVRCASWASDNAQHLAENSMTWFERAESWVRLAADQCYPEDPLLETAQAPSADAAVALTASLEFLSHIICAEYPVLDPLPISKITSSLCEKAMQTKLLREGEFEKVMWIWGEATHLHGLLHLLKTVITYGALSEGVLMQGIMLLCTTVSIPMCKQLCCDIVYTLFTSCYMRDTLLSMSHIMNTKDTSLNNTPIYGMPAMTLYQLAVNGIVFFITQVMDTGPTGFQFSLRTGNCLPVLGKAADCMHPEVLRLVFPYLCRVANDDRIDSILVDDWSMVLSIMTSTIECRTTDKYEDELDGDLDGGERAATLAQLYDCALESIVGVYRRYSHFPPSLVVDLLLRLDHVLSDDLAQELLHLVEVAGFLSTEEARRLETLESLMHLFYFDRSRSIALRQNMVQMCVKVFSGRTNADLAEFLRMAFITSLLEQLHLEEDGKVVENVLEMVEIAMNKAGDSQLFHAILGFAAQAAIEPQYARKIQQQRQNAGSATHHGEASPGQYNFQHSAPNSPPPVAAPALAPAPAPTDSHVSDKNEANYSSFERISSTVHCLLAVLEWRITNTAVSNGMDYDRSVPDTIELTERLLDMLESIHTFPSVQRDILSVFTRLHADSMLKLYILPSCNDSVMDQRVSLRENRRLQLDAATKEGGKTNPVNAECSNISSAASSTQMIQFPIQRYVSILTHLFQTNTDIETYKYLCSGLRVQLGNAYLFKDCRDQIRTLVNYLISFLRMSTYGQDGRTRLSATEKDRMSTLTYSLLIGVMHYKELIQRKQQDSLILAFSEGLILTSTSYATSQICLHALGVGMLEMPGAMMRTLLGILEQLTRIYSSPQISGHLLEFVSSISREHQLYANFHTKDYTTLFAVAINYIQFHNNQRRRESSVSAGNDASGSGSAAAPAKPSVQNVALSQYVFIMAYQIIDVFFLSLPTRLKSEVVDHIVMGLLRANYSRTGLDEANAVCLDMILKNYNRSSDEILKLADAVFVEDLGPVIERSWLHHNAIVTIRAQRRGLLAQIIMRSASGTTLRVVDLPAEVRKKYAERIELPPMSPPISPTADLPNSNLGPAVVRAQSRGRSISRSRRLHSLAMPGAPSVPSEANTLPQDSIKKLLLGELVTNNAAMNRAAHLPISFGPAPCLAQEFITAYPGLQNIDPPELLPSGAEAIARSIRVFDTMNTVDTYKVSVVYVGPGQTTEREILLNQQGSPVYWNFLRGLGTITRLSGMKGFSASLDTSGNDEDGRYTIRWRDLVSQLVFHVGTLMPAREDKHEQIIRKKAHMANDYVQIVFNESGRDYEFDTIPSQFNYVQIIVTPVDGTISTREEEIAWPHGESQDAASPENDKTMYVQLYKVMTQVNPSVPFYGPAIEPKLLTLTALPAFVRSIAIHAAILSNVFSSCKKADSCAAEFISPWRARLRTIHRLRQNAQREAAKSPPTPGADVCGDSLSDFGDIVSNPVQATTASQALGFLVKDLNMFIGRA